jgi:(E)-4-hydroxy-3-methylbut-2-enyl-diphosphate synthase
LFDPDRGECRQPGKAPAGQVWRALPRRDGGSGLDHIKILEDNDFLNFKISMKASDVFMTAPPTRCWPNRPTRRSTWASPRPAGFVGGTVKSAIGLGNLLWMGIGDTLRVSLSADPVEE